MPSASASFQYAQGEEFFEFGFSDSAEFVIGALVGARQVNWHNILDGSRARAKVLVTGLLNRAAQSVPLPARSAECIRWLQVRQTDQLHFRMGLQAWWRPVSAGTADRPRDTLPRGADSRTR